MLGIGVQNAYPALLREDLRQTLQKRGQPVPQTEVTPIGGGVLGDQHQLLNALIDQLLCLAQDLRPRFTDLRSLDRWNGTKGAASIATVRDFEIGRSPHNCAALY